jgi:arylsulfatase
MRCLANFNTGFPNMTGHISNQASTVAEVLRDEGFTTFAVGKWHLCQMAEASPAGPFDQWPLQASQHPAFLAAAPEAQPDAA